MPVEVESSCNGETNQGCSGAGSEQVGSPHDTKNSDGREGQ
jgi:hypothetical protein